eukprot:486158-Amphidinium_carterae.3
MSGPWRLSDDRAAYTIGCCYLGLLLASSCGALFGNVQDWLPTGVEIVLMPGRHKSCGVTSLASSVTLPSDGP